MTHPRSLPLEMTLEEYLAFERRSEGRHEFVAGFVDGMSGTSKRHNRIVARLHMRALAAEGGWRMEQVVEA